MGRINGSIYRRQSRKTLTERRLIRASRVPWRGFLYVYNLCSPLRTDSENQFLVFTIGDSGTTSPELR
jgi:hypothetical protein